MHGKEWRCWKERWSDAHGLDGLGRFGKRVYDLGTVLHRLCGLDSDDKDDYRRSESDCCCFGGVWGFGRGRHLANLLLHTTTRVSLSGSSSSSTSASEMVSNLEYQLVDVFLDVRQLCCCLRLPTSAYRKLPKFSRRVSFTSLFASTCLLFRIMCIAGDQMGRKPELEVGKICAAQVRGGCLRVMFGSAPRVGLRRHLRGRYMAFRTSFCAFYASICVSGDDLSSSFGKIAAIHDACLDVPSSRSSRPSSQAQRLALAR